MSETVPSVVIHMVASLDGYIEGEDGDISWMESSSAYEKGISDEESEKLSKEVLASIDCYVVGSRTYEMAVRLGWPYGDTPIYVLTTRNLSKHKESVNFFNGDVAELIDNLKKQFNGIWAVGGSVVVRELLDRQLADEICISFTPYILGKGKPFFENIANERALALKDTICFNNGFVELWYEIKK